MEKVVTESDVRVLLARVGGELKKVENNVKVYVSKGANLTISVFPTEKAGVFRVRVVNGCTC